MFETVDVREKAEARYDLFTEKILETVQNGKKEFGNKNFYIDVVWRTLREDDDIRLIIVAWEACPTPHFNQTVYEYHHNIDELELLWTLPPEADCLSMYQNRNETDIYELPLLKYVLSFYDGSLAALVDRKEREDGTREYK